METAVYNFSAFAPETRPERKPDVRVIRTASKTRKALRQARLCCTVFLALMLVLMAATVYSSMELSQIKGEVISKQGELTELESENVYLNYQLESQISLRSAEEYATSTLGLIKVNASQIEYVNLQGENEIRVSDENRTNTNFFDFLVSLVLDS